MSAIEQVKQRAAERKELSDYRRRESEMQQTRRDQDMFTAGQNDAYTAVEQELVRRQGPIVMGSPEDRQMQADTERGYRYATTPQPQGPSMFDDFKSAVSKKLGQTQQSISNGLADLFGSSEADVMRNQRNTRMGAEMKGSMEQDARDTAFARAREMGDTSENTINTLMMEEFKKRGL